MDKRPLKVFLCHAHIIPLWDADRDAVPQGDDMRGLYARLTSDGVDRSAWPDKEKPCGARSAVLSLSKCRTILPDWELEIRKAI
jgi:hypothetical protein